MAEKFVILDNEIEFSQERINFVNLKWEYQNLSYAAKAKMIKLFPDTGITTSGNAEVFSSISDNPFIKETKCQSYPNINGYIEERDKYLNVILDIFYRVTSYLNDTLRVNKIYLSTDVLLTMIFEKTNTPKLINDIAKYIKDNSKPHVKSFTFVGLYTTRTYNGYYDKIYQDIENEVIKSENDISTNGSTAKLLVENIIKPFNRCFLAAYDSETYNVLFQKRTSTTKAQFTEYTPVINDREIPVSTLKCLKALMASKEFQEKIIVALSDIVFLTFKVKMVLFSENNLCNYDAITNEAVNRAKEIRKILKEDEVPEDDEKLLMIEMITNDSFEPFNYFAILDKYFDPNGEIQRLARTMGVDVLTHIENQLISIYDEGDISTYESTIELKQKILDAQEKYHLTDSKAYQSILFRQYFLELSDKASEMSENEVIAAYTSIKGGNNTFVEGKGNIVDDGSCILILTRRFKKINAAKYHDIIRNLGLIDDTSGGDKAYAFYEEGENYLNFEEECLKKVTVELTHDDDLSVQNYSSDKFASGEVILGYFQYTRALDFLTDGKCLIITNKRLYTLKEGFTDISQFQECKAVKKLLLTHLIIKKIDNTEIQLPVNKEIMNKAADMINRLVKALQGEPSYIKDTSSSTASASLISSSTSTVKQGFGSLLGKKSKNENTWTCSCGSVNNGNFCPKCGTKCP